MATTTQKTATKKVRGRDLRSGMSVILDGSAVRIASVEEHSHYTGWKGKPIYHSVNVRYVEGSGYAFSSFGATEWVEVAR
jgi:translation elongation factor P/translation initiation factor 5A